MSGGKYSSASTLTCSPEPLLGSNDWRYGMSPISPSSATPSYLFTPKPVMQSQMQPDGAGPLDAKPKEPPPPTDPAIAKKRFQDQAKWGAPPPPSPAPPPAPAPQYSSFQNMSYFPGTVPGLSSNPANMSFSPPNQSEQPQSTTRAEDKQVKKAKDGDKEQAKDAGEGTDTAASTADGGKEGDAKTKKKKQGGGESAQERDRKFQEKQEDEALAMPFTPLPVPKADTSAKRLYPLLVKLDFEPAAFTAPTKIDAEPAGDKAKIPPQYSNYKQDFVEAGATARGLYERIISEGQAQNQAALQQVVEVQATVQSALDRDLAVVDARLLDDTQALRLGEREALHRLELIADTAQMLVRNAASNALGTVASRKATMAGRTTDAAKAADGIETELKGYKGKIEAGGQKASASFKGLAGKPEKAHLTPDKGSDSAKYSPEGPAAMNESPPMDPVIIARAQNRAEAMLNGVRVFGVTIDKTIKNFGNGRKAAFGPFQSYIEMLGTAAPKQIVQMRNNAIKAVDRMAKRAKRTINENANRNEIALVDKHKSARAQIYSQAQANQQGQLRGIEKGTQGQLRSYAMLATSQGQAVAALHQQISGQAKQKPEIFAQFASQASKRTSATALKMVASRLAIMAATSTQARRANSKRAAQSNQVQQQSNEKLILQLQQLAVQAVSTMMQNMLAQENAMRQSAEPITASLDNYKIPAAKDIDTMEASLWNALLEAQQQANSMYYGGGKPGKEGEKSGDEPPPEGIGSLPHEFVTNAENWSKKPESEEHLIGMTKQIGGIVLGDFTKRGAAVAKQMNDSNDPVETLAAVRGMSQRRAQAVIAYYRHEKHGDLRADGRKWLNDGNDWSMPDTITYYRDAFAAYLDGDNKKGALAEMQAAVNYSNNNEQLIAAAKALSPADMEALGKDDKAKAILNEVQDDLDSNHANALKILRQIDPANAAEKVAAADAVLLTGKINSSLQETSDQEAGGDAVSRHMKDVQRQTGQSKLSGYDEFNLKQTAKTEAKKGEAAPLPGEYEFASPEEIKAAQAKSWEKTVSLLGTDGTLPTDGKASGMAWLTQKVEEKRVYSTGENVYEASLRKEQANYILALASHAPDDPWVRASQLLVEKNRPGGVKQENVHSALRNDASNTSLNNPDGPVSAKAAKEQEDKKAKADKEDAEMLHMYEQLSKGETDEKKIKSIDPKDRTSLEKLREKLAKELKANAKDESEGKLLEMQATVGVTNRYAAALAFEDAVNGAGTKEQLLKDTFGAMSKTEIDEAVKIYNSRNTPGLYERLGIFKEGGFFSELSGDDAIEIQQAAMGIPRNERERFQRSRMASKLQKDNSSNGGKAAANEEYKALDKSHNDLLKKAGVKEGDFDKFGVLKRGTDGKYMGKWNSDGSFAPAAKDSAANLTPGAVFDSLMFDAALSTNEAKAEAFKIAVDNVANTIVTAIVVITAIVTTAVTFGGAASFWIPMAITAAGGLAAMAVNATLKGGRYGYEDAFRDLGMTIVQTATAGLAAGMNIAATGGVGALKTAMSASFVKIAASKGPSLLTEIGIGAAAGAFGGAGNALFDDAAWDRGDWFSNIGHGALKGAAGGAASGAVAGGLMRGAQAGAGRLGRFVGYGNALSKGQVGFSAARQAVQAGRKFAGSYAVSQTARTLGGGIGSAASRYMEIQYDRGRGRYAGTDAQAMDEVWTAGVQGAVQSFGEGAAEHGVGKSNWAANKQRQYTSAFIVADGNGPPAINRRPPANDNSSPETKKLWQDLDRPRSNKRPLDANTEASLRAEQALQSRNPASKIADPPTPTVKSPVEEAEGNQTRQLAAANDNDLNAIKQQSSEPQSEGDQAIHPAVVDFDVDGNVTTKLPAADPEAEMLFPKQSALTDDADAKALLQRADEPDPNRVMNSADDEITQKIPKEVIEAVQHADQLELHKKQQKMPARTLSEHIDALDGAIGRRIYDTVDLSDRDLSRLGHMPENSRIMAKNPRDLDAAFANYYKLMAHDRGREVMLVQDRVTGMYMVVQGGPRSVTVPGGHWNVVQHSHPKILNDNHNAVLIRSIPSGKPGDVHTVLVEVDDMIAGAPAGMIISRTSVIDIQVSDASGNITHYQTKFGVIGQGAERGIWVEFHNPKNGYAVERHSFPSLAEYEAHVLKTTGVDLTKQSADGVKAVDDRSRTVKPAATHGDAIPPSIKNDIDFIAGRMAMHDDFDQQAQGLKAKGDLDPHLARAASLENAHARVKAMGLVGEPDSMIRLYNIINDETIQLPLRTMISDITLAATQRHMVETGQLQAGEPLVMLFHGATNARARDLTENGISMARKPGGEGDDFGEGLYFTQHLESAKVYASGRGGTRDSAGGIVIPYIVRGSDLGAIVNVRTGGKHRAAWEAFVTANSHLFSKMNIDPDFLRLPSTMEALMSGKPLPFGSFDAEGRGKVFNAFLESLGAPLNKPDVIFGDLGGPLTSGVQFKGGVTDQAAVRTQRLADILNEQHVRIASVSDGNEGSGLAMKSLDGPDDSKAVQNDSAQSTAAKPLVERLDAMGAELKQKLLAAAIDNMMHRDSVESAMEHSRAIKAQAAKDKGVEAKEKAPPVSAGEETGKLITKLISSKDTLIEAHQPLIMKILLEPDNAKAQALLDGYQKALADSGMEAFVATRRRRVVDYLRLRGGAALQVELEHQLKLHGLKQDALGGLSGTKKQWVLESPALLALWQHDRQMFDTYYQQYKDALKIEGKASSVAFETFVKTRLIKGAASGKMANVQDLIDIFETTRRAKAMTENAALSDFFKQKPLEIEPIRKDVTVPDAADAGVGAEINSFLDFKPGLRVVHPDKMVDGKLIPGLGRGTIMPVDGDNFCFVDDATGKRRLVNVTAFHDEGFRLATHADPFFTDPIPLTRDESFKEKRFEDIANFRKEAGLPDYVSGDKTTGTVAEITINGERFRGTNSGMEPENYPQSMDSRRNKFRDLPLKGIKDNDPNAKLNKAEFLSHAEADALLQAHARFGALPEVVEIFVDRSTCPSCDTYLIELAQQLGVKELRIYYSGEGKKTMRVYPKKYDLP